MLLCYITTCSLVSCELYSEPNLVLRTIVASELLEMHHDESSNCNFKHRVVHTCMHEHLLKTFKQFRF